MSSATGPDVKVTLTGDSSQAVAAIQTLRAVMEQGTNASQEQIDAFRQVTQSARDQTRAISTLRDAFQLQHAEMFEDIAVMNQTASVVGNLANLYVGLQYIILQHQQSMMQLSAATQAVSLNTQILNENMMTYGATDFRTLQAQQQLVESYNALKQQQAQSKIANDQYYASLIQTGGGFIQAAASIAALGGQFAILTRLGAGGAGAGAGLFGSLTVGSAVAIAGIASVMVALAGGMLNVARFKTETNSWSDAMNQAMTAASQLPIGLNYIAEAVTYAGGLVDEFSITTLGNLKTALSGMFPALEGWSVNIQKMFLTIPEHSSQLIAGTQFAMSNVYIAFQKGFLLVQSTWNNGWSGLINGISSAAAGVPGAVQALLGAIISAISSWGATLAANWKSGWGGLVNAVSGAAGAVISAAKSLLNDVISGVEQWGSSLMTKWRNGWNNLGPAISAAHAALNSDVKSLLNDILSGLEQWGAQLETKWRSGWNNLGSAITGISGVLIGNVKNVLNTIISGVSQWGADLMTKWHDGWNALPGTMTSALTSIFSSVESWAVRFLGYWTSFWQSLPKALAGLGGLIASALQAALNAAVGPINQFIQAMNNVINILDSIPFLSTKIPDIPLVKMAEGGVVSSPTLALIGEAGPEAVVPLNQGGGAGGGNTGNITVNVYVQGSVISQSNLVQEINQALYTMGFSRLRR